MSPEDVDIPSLDAKDIKRVQPIVGALLFHGKEVDNKVLVSLNTIGTQYEAATESTNEAIDHLIDYLATYPNDGIIYRSSKIILAAHSYYGFHNESTGRSRTGYHVFLDED